MKVLAIAQGFYNGRRRVGQEFDMPESAMKKGRNGKPALPSWVKEVKAEPVKNQSKEPAKDPAKDPKDPAEDLA